MRHCLFTIVLMACTNTVVASDISGIVLDESGARIAGAKVQLVDGKLSQSQITNDSGEFHFTDAGGRQRILRVESSGFEQYQENLSSGDGIVKVTMHPGHVHEDIVVSSTRTSVPEQENPADVDTIRTP